MDSRHSDFLMLPGWLRVCPALWGTYVLLLLGVWSQYWLDLQLPG